MRLKFGPFDFRLAEKAVKKQGSLGELGATGTLFFAGRLAEDEYNPDLQGEKAIEVYEKMRRSDGQVKAALLACELPLRSAHWDIEPASDSTQDREIAQFVRDNLFEQMTITWDDFLRHILLMLPFGFSAFEKVWELVDGKYRWRKMAPRLPKSINKWDLDKEGGLAGIQQYVLKEEKYTLISIPVEKLLVFSLGREGSNYAGISLLRAAYKHWYYKDQLYRIDGIAAERHGVGVALFNLPSTATTEGEDSDLGKINKIGQSLHAHERSYIALPDGFGFDLKGVTGQLHNIIRSIEHHDMQIVRSILAQFINLGASEVGSYALSQDQSGFFLMSLRAVGKNICDTINRYAIRQLVDYNWSVDRYPQLAVSGLEQRDIGTYCKAIMDVTTAGLIMPDRGIESELRRLLHLPPREGEDTGRIPQFRLAEFQPNRHPRGVEIYVAFDQLNGELDNAENKFIKAAKKIQSDQINAIVSIAIEQVERGEVDKIGTIEVPHQDQMAEAIESIFMDLFNFGAEQVKNELKKQRKSMKAQEPALPTEGLEAAQSFMKARARVTAGVLASKLRAAMGWEALRQIKEGGINPATFISALTSLSDEDLVATAKFSVSEALNFGRQVEAGIEEDDVDRVIYSAIMDQSVCSACAELDGEEFSFPSSEWDEVAPPNKNCEGRDRCRCVGVYVYKSERKGR